MGIRHLILFALHPDRNGPDLTNKDSNIRFGPYEKRGCHCDEVINRPIRKCLENGS